MCSFHSFCGTDLNFGTKNNERMKESTLKSVCFFAFRPSLVLLVNMANSECSVQLSSVPCIDISTAQHNKPQLSIYRCHVLTLL